MSINSIEMDKGYDQQLEKKRYLKQLPKINLENEHKGFLLHGTSVLALTKGHLAGRKYEHLDVGEIAPRIGDLFVVDSNDIGALEDVSFHAQVSARSHFILSKLQVDFRDPIMYEAIREILTVSDLQSISDIPVNEITQDLVDLLFTHRAINPDAFINLIQESRKWRGVILALDSTLKSSEFNYREGDGDYDYRITLNDELPLHFIKGLTARGERDQEYLNGYFDEEGLILTTLSHVVE